MYRPTVERSVERTSAQSPMASLIESIDHHLDGRVMDRAIKREVEDYDDVAENVFAVDNGANIEPPIRNNYGDDSDGDVEAHDYNESGLSYSADPESIPTSALQRMAGEFSADRFLNAEGMSDDDEECNGGWNASNYSQANKKQSDVLAVADQYSNVYSLEGFIENDSVEEVLHLIYSDEKRGLLKFSYRMWALHRLGINPLKEVTCRLNWSQVVPICLQKDITEDGRIKNSLRKYISNYIYNCRQTIVVRENRDELNRIKAQGLSKDRLRKAIAHLVNKTSNKHGWTLYRPIPSYIMRNISGVRNKAYKEKKQKEQASFGDDAVSNIGQPVNQSITENVVTPGASETNRASINSMMKRVFVRGLNSALRDSYREEAIASLGITDWLSVNVAGVDYTAVIPEVLRADPIVARKVQTRLSGYVTLCIRKARTKKMLEKYADEMLQIRENYARENAPEELFVELIKKASDEYGWDGHIPSAVGLKGWIYDRTIDFFKSKLAESAAANAEDQWEDKEPSFTDSQRTPEMDQTADEHLPSSFIELDSYQSAMREVFDSKRHIRSSFRQYAFDALSISATMKGDPSMVDFASVVPSAIHQQPATLRRITQQLSWSASTKVLGQRRALVMQKNAAQMANIRRQYPTSKDVPRDLIKDIIDKTYAEEGWGEHKPAIEPFISKLYEYTMAYVDKLGECNPEEIAESEEASCSKSGNGSVHDDDAAFSDVSPVRRSDSLQLRRSERNVRKRSIEENDALGYEMKKKLMTNTAKQGNSSLIEFDGDHSSPQASGSLEAAIKELFERDLKGPLNSAFRKKAVEELGITMSFSGILEDLDYSSLIPAAIQCNDQVHEQVRQQIISYLIGFIRRCRLTYIAEEKATRLADLLKDYPKHNSIPLNTLYALIHEVAREKGWKRYLPLASKLKYRIYERRELIMKRAAAQMTQHDAAGPSATAIVATGSAVTPLQAAALRNKRSSFGLLQGSKGDKRMFLTPGGEESEIVTSSTMLPMSTLSSSRRSSTESTSGCFMQTMKNKLKNLGPEEMSALMNRINEHVRDKMLAQLTSQIVHNFDPNQQDSVFSEILGIVDAHKTGSP